MPYIYHKTPGFLYPREAAMLKDLYTVGAYQVVRILENLETDADLSELKKLVEQTHDLKHLALAFTADSCLYSKAAAVVIECYRILHKRGGTLAIVKPNSSILFVLGAVGLKGLVHVCESEEDLAHEALPV